MHCNWHRDCRLREQLQQNMHVQPTDLLAISTDAPAAEERAGRLAAWLALALVLAVVHLRTSPLVRLLPGIKTIRPVLASTSSRGPQSITRLSKLAVTMWTPYCCLCLCWCQCLARLTMAHAAGAVGTACESSDMTLMVMSSAAHLSLSVAVRLLVRVCPPWHQHLQHVHLHKKTRKELHFF